MAGGGRRRLWLSWGRSCGIVPAAGAAAGAAATSRNCSGNINVNAGKMLMCTNKRFATMRLGMLFGHC